MVGKISSSIFSQKSAPLSSYEKNLMEAKSEARRTFTKEIAEYKEAYKKYRNQYQFISDASAERVLNAGNFETVDANGRRILAPLETVMENLTSKENEKLETAKTAADIARMVLYWRIELIFRNKGIGEIPKEDFLTEIENEALQN